MGSGRILIVDDDRLFRTYACDILKPEGYQVWTAATGEEAFRVLKQDRFDVIIVDVVMENLSGLDLVRRIREADPEQERKPELAPARAGRGILGRHLGLCYPPLGVNI